MADTSQESADAARMVNIAVRRAFQLHHLLLPLYSCEQSEEWLFSRQPSLSDRLPIDMLLDVDDFEAVLAVIHRVMDGAYS